MLEMLQEFDALESDEIEYEPPARGKAKSVESYEIFMFVVGKALFYCICFV